eukprot:1263015-Rhodomonas_salina.1
MFETVGYCLWRVHHVARAGSGVWGPGWASWWVWFSGLVCVVAGAVLDFLTLGLAKEYVVSLIGSSSLVMNMLVAPLIGERVCVLDWAAAALIVAGVGLTVVGGSGGSAVPLTLEGALARYGEPGAVGLLCGVLGLALALGGVLSGEYWGRLREDAQ